MRPIERVLGKFPNALREGNDWKASCPIHDDTHPSLRISEAVDGTVLVKCRVCGKDRTKDILAAVGLSFPDLFQKADRVTPGGQRRDDHHEPSSPNGTPRVKVARPKPNGSSELVQVYVYEDERRQPIAEKHRFHHPDGSKTFLQKRHGANEWGLNGTKLPLYRVAEIKEARPEWPIAICEGEKDADALRMIGLVATTNAEGATTWRPEHSETLRGRRVFILQDNDDAGRERTRILVKALAGVVSELKVVALANLPEKGDVSDWLEAGHTGDELIDLVNATPALETPPKPDLLLRDRAAGSSPGLVEMTGTQLADSDLRLEDLPYLPVLGETGFIVKGWSHILAAAWRAGKTELLSQCAADWVETGLQVLVLSEEPAKIWQYRVNLEPRLQTDRFRVVFALGAERDAQLARASRGAEDVIIVDTLRNLLRPKDENDSSAMAELINPWIAAARAGQRTLVVAAHERKGGGQDGEGIAGGHGLPACFDIAIELLRDRHHPKRRVLKTQPRLIEQREVLYELTADRRLRALGHPSAIELDEVKRRCLDALNEEWQTTKTVASSFGEPKPDEEQIRRALIALAQAGLVLRDPDITAEKIQGKTAKWKSPRREPLTSYEKNVVVGSEVAPPDPVVEAALLAFPGAKVLA